ncbi:ATP-dependent 5'-3' DNA helicase hcs1, variant 3 [Lathyrus oleraceus]|uniref:ATP-dependent 5'-3' DNA helicase hcs1, variant 3 n=1 Tax=Pisum sativum TaxID=3888 RepID=A0A9D5ADV5_PEA|nr:ATP-dependent 5'-3' DNA helicase hcs1, variant 3 [Pisum sativum]
MVLQNPSSTASLLLATTTRLFMASSALDYTLLVLCGKSLAENETAIAIKANNTLKLPDKGKLSIILHSEFNKSVMQMQQKSFQFSSFVNSLSTNQFGRFLIWSPELSSTHDVVSHNFCELPIGTVCVADIQNKGRGLIGRLVFYSDSVPFNLRCSLF